MIVWRLFRFTFAVTSHWIQWLTLPSTSREMSWMAGDLGPMLGEAKKRLARSQDNFPAGGYGKGRHRRQRKKAAAPVGATGSAATAANLTEMEVEGSDSEDETALNPVKGLLNAHQRARALEGCLLSTHLVPKEFVINPHALGAAQMYMKKLDDGPNAHLGPPSLMAAMAVLDFLWRRK
ncbi:unnamed protein product [Prorocentrum cordatum]|uniref:Uncharacterized protein n=1 Tax=Prorocentrum cordatum TaxID=2364126 RepID=A0ABN9XDH7_9DINO|nr:unnamed protein product [Polarella glacialis]